MDRFDPGDRVRVDIPDTGDPDFERFHRRTGTVEEVTTDDVSDVTGDQRDDYQYLVSFDDGETAEFRWRDLRPAAEE
jgi:ribosomal protein L21E